MCPVKSFYHRRCFIEKLQRDSRLKWSKNILIYLKFATFYCRWYLSQFSSSNFFCLLLCLRFRQVKNYTLFSLGCGWWWNWLVTLIYCLGFAGVFWKLWWVIRNFPFSKLGVSEKFVIHEDYKVISSAEVSKMIRNQWFYEYLEIPSLLCLLNSNFLVVQKHCKSYFMNCNIKLSNVNQKNWIFLQLISYFTLGRAMNRFTNIFMILIAHHYW